MSSRLIGGPTRSSLVGMTGTGGKEIGRGLEAVGKDANRIFRGRVVKFKFIYNSHDLGHRLHFTSAKRQMS